MSKGKSPLIEMTKSHIRLSETSYKYYQDREIELKEQLDSTPRIFKNKRAKIQKEIQEVQSKADKHFNNYLEDINSLYDDTGEVVNNDR